MKYLYIFVLLLLPVKVYSQDRYEISNIYFFKEFTYYIGEEIISDTEIIEADSLDVVQINVFLNQYKPKKFIGKLAAESLEGRAIINGDSAKIIFYDNSIWIAKGRDFSIERNQDKEWLNSFIEKYKVK